MKLVNTYEMPRIDEMEHGVLYDVKGWGCVALRCPRKECNCKHLISYPDRWKWDAKTQTAHPSLVCNECPAHYFITNGQVVHV